jgi:peptidyl-prolyl cis-trans isomerase B (cyclophilin B)
MGIMKKRILISSALLLSVITVNPSASAAPGSVTCKTATSVGHTPMKLGLPKIKKPFKDRTITLKTNCGDIVIAAFGTKAPLTVTSETYLANSGYYNKTICHRMVTSGIFIIQCGDPTASGSGGPQWTVPDENLPTGTGNTYPAGTVAMANSGPNTNGSQFFFTYKDGSQLGPNYTIWGKVIKGLDILNYIASKGIGADGVAPAQAFEIISAKAA